MLSADHRIQCRCGGLQGSLSRAAPVIRLSCYCRDCQAYAHALGNPDHILDRQGGTDIVATLQQYLTFTAGTDSLACLSLAPNGLLRWYASCCNIPVANTARDPRLSYVGVVHTCLVQSPSELTAVFGPARSHVNTKHAKGSVATNVLGTMVSTGRIMASVLRARVSGTWKRSPLFQPGSSAPVVVPRVLSFAERARAQGAI